MKNVWVFFILIALCSCSVDNDFYDNMDKNVVTRNGTTEYYFYTSFSPNAERYDYLTGVKGFSIYSYMETDEGVTAIEPEIISKPDWVVNINCVSVYYKAYVLVVTVSENDTDSERTGTILIGQPNSSKRLSFPLFQGQRTNTITIKVATLYANHYEFTATTTYPVKDEITIRIPFEVYNDSGEMKNESARIIVAKNQTVGTTIMDYNGCPLVYYHGNLKGYRLHEGTIWANDIYNYSFNRYWY